MEGKLGGEGGAEERDSECEYQPEGSCGALPVESELPGGSGLFASRIRAVPWKLRDVIVASALFVPAGVGGSLGLGFALARMSLVEDEILAIILGSTLLPVALLAGSWVFGVRRHNVNVSFLGFRRTSLWSALWLPLVALSIGLTTMGVYALLMEGLGIDILVPDQKLEEIGALEGFARVPTFAIVGLLAPFGEEVFFRGFLLAALVPLIGGLRGAVVSSAIFSAAHLQVGTLFPIFVIGMLLAWLYLRTGSIWPSFAAHAAQNLLALIFLELPIDAPTAILQT